MRQQVYVGKYIKQKPQPDTKKSEFGRSLKAVIRNNQYEHLSSDNTGMFVNFTYSLKVSLENNMDIKTQQNTKKVLDNKVSLNVRSVLEQVIKKQLKETS